MVHGKTILVLGGGIGGIVAATHLRRLLPREHRVILIDGIPARFSPSFLWVMVGQRSADRISRPMAASAKRGIELIRGAIEHFDPADQVVRVDGNEITREVRHVASHE